ncbi:MAG: SPW repeat protein [Caldilineaceae bacterium]|nr:SPW repeat protein [Caldilineaceae bacterium]
MQKIKNMNWIMAVVGIWVAIAPFLLRYGHIATARWNDLIVGLTIFVLAIASALTSYENGIRTMGWVTTMAGLWLLLAPFILGYSVVVIALWTDIIAGAVILALSMSVERELPQIVRHTS